MSEKIKPTLTLAKLYESQDQLLDALIIYQKLNLQNSSLELEKKIEELNEKIFSNLQGNYTQLVDSIFNPLEKKKFKILPHEDYVTLSANPETDEEDEEDLNYFTFQEEKTSTDLPEDPNLEEIIDEEKADLEAETPASEENEDLEPKEETSIEPKPESDELPPTQEDQDTKSQQTDAMKIESEDVTEVDKIPVKQPGEQEPINTTEEISDTTDNKTSQADEPDESDLTDLDKKPEPEPEEEKLNHTKIDPNSINSILTNIQEINAEEFESFLKSTFGPDRDLREFKLSQIQKAIMLFKKEI